jgi:hypothetical protein
VNAAFGRNVVLLDDFLRELRADTVNVLKRDHNALACRYVNTGNTCHFSLHVAG